jgi:hypothetical protein
MVDHVLMATGYRVDVRKYEFLSGSLVSALRLIDGHLVLGRGFESSVRGLHFLGAPAVWSYGPLMRFVAGADLAARAVARSVVCARRPAVGRPVTDTLQTPQSVIVPSIEINTLQGQLPHPRTKGAETTLASSSRAGR